MLVSALISLISRRIHTRTCYCLTQVCIDSRSNQIVTYQARNSKSDLAASSSLLEYSFCPSLYLISNSAFTPLIVIFVQAISSVICLLAMCLFEVLCSPGCFGCLYEFLVKPESAFAIVALSASRDAAVAVADEGLSFLRRVLFVLVLSGDSVFV